MNDTDDILEFAETLIHKKTDTFCSELHIHTGKNYESYCKNLTHWVRKSSPRASKLAY